MPRPLCHLSVWPAVLTCRPFWFYPIVFPCSPCLCVTVWAECTAMQQPSPPLWVWGWPMVNCLWPTPAPCPASLIVLIVTCLCRVLQLVIVFVCVFWFLCFYACSLLLLVCVLVPVFSCLLLVPIIYGLFTCGSVCFSASFPWFCSCWYPALVQALSVSLFSSFPFAFCFV